MNSNWLNVGKECGSVLSSRWWRGALRDDAKNGWVAEDTILNHMIKVDSVPLLYWEGLRSVLHNL